MNKESHIAKVTREKLAAKNAKPLEITLRDCSGAITFHTGHMEERIAALQTELLPTQLKVGLYCLRAHEAFCITDPKKRGAMKGQSKKLVHVDELPTGFEGWLAAKHPQIKKPTAYRWMTAFKGLGLDSTATEKQVDAELQKLLSSLPSLSLKSLCDAAIESVTPPAPEPPRLEQQEFDFLRQSLSAFREETESLCRLKEKLDAYPDFKRAATARLYSALVELTGTDWAPSDHPDALATIDPDAITI
jgi:hypothetical protein